MPGIEQSLEALGISVEELLTASVAEVLPAAPRKRGRPRRSVPPIVSTLPSKCPPGVNSDEYRKLVQRLRTQKSRQKQRMRQFVKDMELPRLVEVLEGVHGKGSAEIIATLTKRALELEFWLHEYQVSSSDALPLKQSLVNNKRKR